MGYFTADLNYVIFMRRFPEPQPAPEQLPYFWGGVVTNWSAWQVPSLVGILLADRIPTAWGLGFAGTLALLGLMYSLLVRPRDAGGRCGGRLRGGGGLCAAAEAEHRGGDRRGGGDRPADRPHHAAGGAEPEDDLT